MNKQYALIRTITFASGVSEDLLLKHSISDSRPRVVSDCEYYNQFCSRNLEGTGFAITYAVHELPNDGEDNV